MNDFVFDIPTKVYFGREQLSHLSSELKKYGKRVIAFSGCAAEDAAVCNDCGIDAFFPIVQGITTLEEALKPDNAYRNLYRTACQVFRLIRAYTADC